MKQTIKKIKENIQISFENEKTAYNNLSLLFNLELKEKNRQTIEKKLTNEKIRRENKRKDLKQDAYSEETKKLKNKRILLKKALNLLTFPQLKQIQKNYKINRNYANKTIMIDDLLLKIPLDELEAQIKIINKKMDERKIELEAEKIRERRIKKIERKEKLKKDKEHQKRIKKIQEKEEYKRKEEDKQRKKAEIKQKIKNKKLKKGIKK